ncbi:MAG: hypothetical protein ACOCUU_02560 [Nanoarchaeota archaeon]
MKKINKSTLWTLTIIIFVILLAIGIINFPEDSETLEKEAAKCIGDNSVLYVQVGCHYCDIQEEMFGENIDYLNIFLCNNNWTKCNNAEIKGTPSWKINEKLYTGVQSIEKLKSLTGC